MTEQEFIMVDGEKWVYADEQIFPAGTDPEVTGISCNDFEDGIKALKFFGYLVEEEE